jgi:hypothetical protein
LDTPPIQNFHPNTPKKVTMYKKMLWGFQTELQKTHEACVADKIVRWWRKALALTLSCTANQRNTWTFGGAPLIQTFALKTLSLKCNICYISFNLGYMQSKNQVIKMQLLFSNLYTYKQAHKNQHIRIYIVLTRV